MEIWLTDEEEIFTVQHAVKFASLTVNVVSGSSADNTGLDVPTFAAAMESIWNSWPSEVTLKVKQTFKIPIRTPAMRFAKLDPKFTTVEVRVVNAQVKTLLVWDWTALMIRIGPFTQKEIGFHYVTMNFLDSAGNTKKLNFPLIIEDYPRVKVKIKEEGSETEEEGSDTDDEVEEEEEEKSSSTFQVMSNENTVINLATMLGPRAILLKVNVIGRFAK